MLTVEFDPEVIDLIDGGPAALPELIVMELYRRGIISSGRGAELMHHDRLSFIQRASSLGIPAIRVSGGELDEELRILHSL